MPYAPVGELDIHYEQHGQGQPMMLLYGGMQTRETGSTRRKTND